MKYDFKPLGVTTPMEPANNKAILQAKFAVEQLTGALNKKSPDRAVRVGELLDTGLFQYNDAGLLVPKETAASSLILPGRSRIINGNFKYWQRVASLSANGYSADRWLVNHSGATFNAFPVALPGEGTSSGTALGVAVSNLGAGINFRQPVEDVSTLAGKKAVISFRARGNFTGMQLNLRHIQSFGSGGSANTGGGTQTVTLDTAMRNYSVVMDIGSTAGKTIGANSYLAIIFDLLGTGTYYITDFQIEEGDVFTPFEWRPDALQLQLCQRYYEKSFSVTDVPANGLGSVSGTAAALTTGTARSTTLPFKVTKRINPSMVFYSPAEIPASLNRWALYNGSGWSSGACSLVTISTAAFSAELGFGSGLTFGLSYVTSGNWTADADF